MARAIRLPMQAWLAGSHLFTLLLPLAALIGTGALAADLLSQTRQDVEHQAVAVAALAADRDPAALSPVLAAIKQETLAGFQVVDAAGRVVASSGGGTSGSLAE